MNAEQIAPLLLSTLWLVLLWLLFFHCIRNHRLDAFRQQLFQLRDELYDFAAEGDIAFSHPAYGRLRSNLNGLIRFAHKVTFCRALIGVAAQRVSPDPNVAKRLQRLYEPLSALPDGEVKAKLTEMHVRMMVYFVKYLVFGSPFLLLCLGLFALYCQMRGAVVKLSDLLTNFADCIPGIKDLEADALDEEESHALMTA